MAEPQVFVSYSHADSEHLKSLKKHLKPLERLGVLKVWTDQAIDGGAVWRDEILAAIESATVAVFLISADFLASEFIAEVEVPRFLQRHDLGEVTILPVYLSPSQVESTPYPFEDRDGQQSEALLSSFQGFASPKKPARELSWSDREREYGRLAKRLKELASAGSASALPALDRMAAPAVHSPGDEPRLTVELLFEGGDLMIRQALGEGRTLGQRQRPWRELKARLEDLASPIDDFKPSKQQAWFHDRAMAAGEELFKVLFGDERTWRSLFRMVFARSDRDADPMPWFQGVHLRIVTADPLLLSLPWGLLACGGRWLTAEGWRIATGSEVAPTLAVNTEPRQEVLLLTASSQVPGASDHLDHVRDLLREVWGEEAGEQVRTISDAGSLRASASGLRPHLVYIYAKGSGDGVILDDGVLSYAELAALLVRPAASPRAVIFAGSDLADAGRVPFEALTPDVPLILWRRLPDWSAEAADVVLQVLGRWLRTGLDPAAARAEVAQDAGSLEALALAVHADHRTWTTETSPVRSKGQDVKLQLDRLDQKSRAVYEVEDLLRYDLRVLALIAHATPGYGAELAASQLVGAVETRLGRDKPIAQVEAEIPDVRERLDQDLRGCLDEHLGRLDGESVRQMLRRHGPELLRPGQKGVLWIDWRTYGDGLERPRLEEEHLAAWLRMAHDHLVPNCPPELRLVSFLCLEVAEDELDDLDTCLESLEDEALESGRRFRYAYLKTLGKVPYRELVDFLRDHTDCPPGLRVRVGKAIRRETAGHFDQTTHWVLQAARSGWATVLAQLERADLKQKVRRSS